MRFIAFAGGRRTNALGITTRVIYGIVLIAVAVLVRVPLESILGGREVFILLEPGIVIAAWYGGLLSGATATLAAIIASAFFYLQLGSPDPDTARGDFLALIIFSINGLVISMLSSGLRGAFDRADVARVIAENSAVRSERLQRFALAMNRPMGTRELADTAIVQAVDLLGANGALVATGRANDAELYVVATHGFTGGVEAGVRVANDPGNPLGDVVQHGDPIILHGQAERMARYPIIADQFAVDGDSIVLPLFYQEVTTGAIYLNFAGSSGLGSADLEYLRSIGVQFGSALERSILIEASDAMAATEQARAAELDTVLGAIGDGLLVADEQGKVILANPAAERLLGARLESMSDLPVRKDDVAYRAATFERYLARSPGKGKGWLEISHFPVAARGTSSDVVLIRDVTSAVENDLQRDAFLGVLSHELRTPITSIIAAVHLLRREQVQGKGLGPELLSDIDVESTRLHRIVEDLLVLTRSERGALDVRSEPVLVQRVVKSVVERARLDEPNVQIELVTNDDMAPVDAEPTYVQQIVRNLLSNALKYGRTPGQPIQIAISQGPDSIETRVLDRGVGFGPGDTDRLFTLFYRNPKANRSAPGAGIGLYVCRLLAEAMGGTAWARTRPGGGAEFGFSLPLIGDDFPSREPAAEAVPDLAGR